MSNLYNDEFDTTTVNNSGTSDNEVPTAETCNQYFVLLNKTNFLYDGFRGIPENLIINCVVWAILIIIFTILRKNAWNYGRLALVQKYDSRWTQIFYGTDDELRSSTNTGSISSFEFNVHIDDGYFSWIPALFKVKDEHILAKCGRDAVQYLSFQRYIIAYTMLVCGISIVVVLPINYSGITATEEKDFASTTLMNLETDAIGWWINVTLAFLFLPLVIAFTRHFSRLLELREVTTSVSRTLMVSRVPRKACHKDIILKHFQEAYPEVEVEDVEFAYDIQRLLMLDKKRDEVHSAYSFSDLYFKETGQRLEIYNYACGAACGCCCSIFGHAKVDAIDCYSKEEKILIEEVENEKVKALLHPTGIAFVTFDSIENTQLVLKDHLRTCRCSHNPPSSSVSAEVKQYNWIMTDAPLPDDIYWGNLAVSTKHWYLKSIFINLLLFAFLFFVSTPPIVIGTLEHFLNVTDNPSIHPLVSEALPSLLMWGIAALMPVVVTYTDKFLSHWTRSAENHSIMRKAFVFMLFMMVILPSLGFTSANLFIQWFVLQEKDKFRWECIFLPDNCAFFVNYVITSAFIGTGLELLRIPELFLYSMNLLFARSEAETASIRKNIIFEFQFGVHYSWMLLVFAMTIIYSVPCPIITVFGLLYLLMKHAVDKYNIYFAYGPSKIRKSIHTTAINFVILSVVILQWSILFFTLIREDSVASPICIYSILLICITFLVFITHNTFNWFRDLSPVEYKSDLDEFNQDLTEQMEGVAVAELDTVQFIPSVLKKIPVYPVIQNNQSISSEGTQNNDRFYSSPRKSYGTTPSTEIINNTPAVPEKIVSYQNYSPKVIIKAEINSADHSREDKDTFNRNSNIIGSNEESNQQAPAHV